MKRFAALLGLLLSVSPAVAAAEEFKAPRIELSASVIPEAGLSIEDIESRPYKVNAKRYERVRRHIEKYGGDGTTEDGNPARCIEAIGEELDIIACMNFAVGAPMGDGAQVFPALYVTYSGPVEVSVRDKSAPGFETEITFYLSTDGKLEAVVETTTTLAPAVTARSIRPGSLEARSAWQGVSNRILSLLPTYEI